MEKLWQSAVKYCGITSVAGFFGYRFYPQIIGFLHLKNLTHTELFVLLSLIVVIVFNLCVILVMKRPLE